MSGGAADVLRALGRVLWRMGCITLGVLVGSAAVHFLGWWAALVVVVPCVVLLWWAEARR